MTEEYRDMTIPFSDKELEDLRTFLCFLPSYKNGKVGMDDIPAIIKGLRYKRTPEQIKAYEVYWKESLGGEMPVETFIEYAKGIHKTHLISREFVRDMDKNKDGLISADEFSRILQCLSAHDPKLSGITFVDFVKEADLNQDGTVDIEECVEWIRKKTNN